MFLFKQPAEFHLTTVTIHVVLIKFQLTFLQKHDRVLSSVKHFIDPSVHASITSRLY